MDIFTHATIVIKKSKQRFEELYPRD